MIFENLTEEEAKNKEVELIKQYKTQNPNFGYNMTPGGEGYSGEDNPWFGKHHTEESKLKMSQKKKGVPKSEEFKKYMSEKMKGRVFSEETKQKMREHHHDTSGENNYWYGKKRDPEHMKRMVIASKTPEAIEKMKKNKVWYSGADNPNAKSVICLDTGKIYSTVNEAASDTGCSASKISAVCHGKRNHTGNLHFKLLEDYKNE